MVGQMGYFLSKPKTWGTVVASTATGAGLATVAGQLGPQVLAPEEIVTVPGAALLGFRTGMTLASAENAFRTEAGHAYNEMLENGISHETAKKIALGVGSVNAALEAVQVDELVDAYKILKKSGVTTAAGKIAKELLDRGISIIGEDAIEVAQEGVTIGGAEVAHRIDKGEGLYTASDVGERLHDTAKSSALAFGVMNVPATVTNLSTSNYNSKVNQSPTAQEVQRADAKAVKDIDSAYEQMKQNGLFGQRNQAGDSIRQATETERRYAGKAIKVGALDADSYRNGRVAFEDIVRYKPMETIKREYAAAVDPEMVKFAEYALNNPGDNKSAFQMKDVSARQADDIKRLTGIETQGFGTEAKTNAFRHIENGHGANGTTDQSMADLNDVARMQYVIDNYDNMELLPEKTKAFLNSEQEASPMVRIKKRVNGNYYVVEAVPETSRQKLEIISAYKEKAVNQMTNDNPSPNVRNESDITAFNTIIPQNAENSNNNILGDGGMSVSTAGTTSLNPSTADAVPLPLEKGGEGGSRRGKLGSAKAVADILSSAYGVKFAEYSAEDGLNGYYDPETRTIYINQRSDEPVLATISHELIHDLKVNDPGAFNLLRQWVKNDMNQNRFSQYRAELLAAYDAIGKDYSGMTETELYEHVLEEAMADLCSEVMRDPNTITRIAKADRNLAQRIMDKLSEILETIRKSFSEYFGGETQEIRELVKDFAEVKAVYQSVLENSAKRGSQSEGASGDVKFSYGGKHAEGMNQGMLSKAKRMRRRGATKEQIFWETGWFVGLDGKWRFEIDDSQMTFDFEEPLKQRMKEMVVRLREAEPQYTEAEAYAYILKNEQPVFRLGDLVHHPKLFSYYPDLADTALTFSQDTNKRGSYSSLFDTITISTKSDHPKVDLIHEIQHAIQHREGFTRGSNLELWDGTEQEKIEQYYYTAGEIEAREVGDRLDLDEQWRKVFVPMQNVPGAYFAEDAPGYRAASGSALSIETLPDGKRYVQADRQVISGDDPKVWAEQVETYINEKIRNGKDVTIYTDDGDAVLLTDRTAGKITYYNQNLPTDKEYASKLRAATHIDELAKVSRADTRPIEPDFEGKHGEFAKDGWQYRTAYFVDNDGNYYKIGISTALNDQGKVVYNIGSIRKRSNPVRGSSAPKGGAQSGIASTTSIPQSNGTVNTSIRSGQQKDASFDKPMSVSRKQRATENTLDYDSGSVVEYNQDITNEIVTDTTQMHPDDAGQLDNVVMQKQVKLKQQGKQYVGRQFAYTNDYFVVFDSRGVGEYDFVMAIWVDGNEDAIDFVRGKLENGTVYRGTRGFGAMLGDYWHRRSGDSRHHNGVEAAGTRGSYAEISLRASGRDGERRSGATQANSAGRARVEYNFEDEQDGIKLSVSRKQRATEAIAKYKETGDVRDLPERAWAKGFRRDTENRSRYLSNQMQDLEYQLEYADEESRASIEGAINTLRKKIEDAAKSAGIAVELNDVLDNATLNRNVDLAPVVGDLQDTDVVKSGNYYFNDFYRNIERFFGKHFHVAKPLVDGFDAAGGDWARMQVEKTAELYQYVVKELGIKPGSKESKAVQWIGEKQRNPLTKEEVAEIDRIVEAQTAERGLSKKQATELKKSLRVEYNETMLRNEFGDEAAERILKAERWFRQQYEELIDEINRILRLMYPNRPDKQIPKRQDYMRHFREMETGFRGLRNIFEVDNNIDPKLVLVSDHTKPKEKWLSIKQQREGNVTEEGAIEGFLDYLPQAAYAIHINPYIDKFRGLARDIAELKAETGDTSANGFVQWLNAFANSLAGKTGFLDRGLITVVDGAGKISSKILHIEIKDPGRKLIKALNWFNNLGKSNGVKGNISSLTKQVMNIPNGIQLLHNPTRIFQGVWDVVAGIAEGAGKTNPSTADAVPLPFTLWGTRGKGGKGKVRENYKKSDFLTERFLDKSYAKFKKNGVSKTFDWFLSTADEFGTRVIWNAAYREGVALHDAGEITETPERYADVLTRRAVAGRGVGEVPLAYQSQIGKLALPFQLEPSNYWNVQRDVLSGKAESWGKESTPLERSGRMMIGWLAAFAFDSAIEALTGSSGGFNPLGDILDGILQGWKEEEDEDLFDKIVKMGQRSAQNVAADFIGNRAFGWVLGEFLSSSDEDWAKNLFNDRIFQSQGANIPAIQSGVRAWKDYTDGDWVGGTVELATSFLTPFGGKQIDKTVRGVADFIHGGKYQNDIYKEWSTGERGDKRYDIPQTAGNLAKSFLFGPSALKEGQDYWDDKKLEGYAQTEMANANTKAMKQFAKDYNKAHPDSEVEALYKEVKDFSVYPFSPVNMVQDFKRDNKEHTLRLLPAEQAQYQKEQDKRMQENYEAVFKTDAYRRADAEGKAELLEEARKEAETTVRQMMQNDYLYKNMKAYGRLLTEGEHIKRVYDDATDYSGWSKGSRTSCLLSYASAAERDGRMTQAGAKKLQEAMGREQTWTALDEELYRITSEGLETQLMYNAYDIFSFTKDKKDYCINVPAEDLADVWIDMEARFRTKLNQTIATATYQNATLKEKQDAISKAKSSVRKEMREELKGKYGYSIDDDFAKLMRMK